MIHHQDDAVTVYADDCLEVLRTLEAESVDSVVTDPPYGLEFMGRDWDKFKTYAGGNPNMKPQGATIAATEAGEWQPGRKYGAPKKNPKCRKCGGFQRQIVGRPSRCVCEAPDWDTRTREYAQTFQQWCTEWAAECLRVLKPGGHLLAFGGTRTWHRLACAIEDAGFEVRDSIAWLYGQGFAKSLNIDRIPASKSPFCQCHLGESTRDAAESSPEHDMPYVWDGDLPASLRTSRGPGPLLLPGVSEPGASADRAMPAARGAGRAERLVEGRGHVLPAERELCGSKVRPLPAASAGDGPEGRVHSGAPADHGPVDGSPVDPLRVREPHRPEPSEQRTVEPGAVPDQRGSQAGRGWPVCQRCGKSVVPPGLGTALKPAHEPIVVARKPLAGTVAANVLTHGTGALNIDACRVEGIDPANAKRLGRNYTTDATNFGDSVPLGQTVAAVVGGNLAGRWPPNVILDDQSAAELDRQSGTSVSRGGAAFGNVTFEPESKHRLEKRDPGFGDSGGASRFFPTFRYEPKAPTHERPRVNGTAHPTTKPLDLMRWLVRLVTPPGGIVLDPFAGSGTTGEACIVEGFRAILIEREPDYLPLIVARLTKPIAGVLDFGGVA